MSALIDLTMLYGVEVWGCMISLEAIEQVKLHLLFVICYYYKVTPSALSWYKWGTGIFYTCSLGWVPYIQRHH